MMIVFDEVTSVLGTANPFQLAFGGKVNSVQHKLGELYKARLRNGCLYGDFLGVGDFLRSACSLGIPLENL